MKNPSGSEAVVNPAMSGSSSISAGLFDLAITCSHCQEKQVVQIHASVSGAQVVPQYIRCLKCAREFNPMAPGQIVGGPFYPHE